MKAVQITRYDGPEGLSYDTIVAPEPGTSEIAIDVHYAGANYVEALFADGLVPNPLPWVPGIEVSGSVRALGDGVGGFSVGDAVAALTINNGGGYGQVAVTHADLVTPLPAGMDPALAAAVPSNTTTALLALEKVARLARGEHVLVHAAVGGLGSQFGQVARVLGAGRVVGSSAPRGNDGLPVNSGMTTSGCATNSLTPPQGSLMWWSIRWQDPDGSPVSDSCASVGGSSPSVTRHSPVTNSSAAIACGSTESVYWGSTSVPSPPNARTSWGPISARHLHWWPQARFTSRSATGFRSRTHRGYSPRCARETPWARRYSSTRQGAFHEIH